MNFILNFFTMLARKRPISSEMGKRDEDKKETSRSGHLLNLGLLAVLLTVVFLPESPIRTRLVAWRAQARLSVLVEEHWQALAATSARMDTGDANTAMIIEFGDYECPFCRDSHAHLEAVMESDRRLRSDTATTR